MLRNFFTLVAREFKLFYQNSTLFSVFILGPLVYGLLLGFLYKDGKVKDLPVIIVDQDFSPTSDQLKDMLSETEIFKIAEIKRDKIYLEKDVIYYDATAVVVIPERFEANLLQGRYPEIEVYMNMTNLMTANFASKAIQQTLGSFNAGVEMKALQRRGMNPSRAAASYEPVKVNYFKLYNSTGNYLVFMWPALLAVVLQQVILLAMAVSFAAEFEKRTFATQFLTRTRAGFSSLLVKVIPIWVISIIHVFIFYCLHIFFKAEIPHGWFNFFVITALFVAAASFLGTMVSIVIGDSLKATQILMLISTPAFLIGGFTWPAHSMPQAVQYLADIIPLTPFLQGFKVLLMQKGTLSDIIPSLRHLGILLVIYSAVSYLFLKIKVRKMQKSGDSENQPSMTVVE